MQFQKFQAKDQYDSHDTRKRRILKWQFHLNVHQINEVHSGADIKEVHNVDLREDHNGADIDVMLLHQITVSNYSVKNAHADSAMQRMFISIIKTKNAFNASCLSKERSFHGELPAHALGISVNSSRRLNAPVTSR
jgi:hypothetical protein